MSINTNFNANPYYDDYDEDKNFLKILFRPGYAVQARELTQLQTILQKQVTRFGSHVFKNGSYVLGGLPTIDLSCVYLKIKTTDNSNNAININNYDGKIIADSHSFQHYGGIAKVLAVDGTDTANSPTLIIKNTSPSRANLTDGDVIYTIEEANVTSGSTNTAVLISSNSTGNASVVSISDGIYFVDGFFAKIEEQTIILEKYSNAPTYKIGLTISDDVVDETSDTSLLDPALNASNYQAPGATRFRKTLTLSKRAINSVDDTLFIELVRIEQGVVTKITKSSSYAELEKTLARRTYDESGNYTVRPFIINLVDNIPVSGGTANSSLITAALSPGKAYLKGYEFETVIPANIDVKKARTTRNVSNYNISCTYGNYFVGSNVSGTFDISTTPITDIHCVTASLINKSNTTSYNSTKIGTARLYQLNYVSSSNTQLSNTYTYDVFVNDTRFTPITGNVVAGTTSTINLALGGASSNTVDVYVGAKLRITAGAASDSTIRTVTAYTGSPNNTITVDSAFSSAPNTTSTYSIDFSAKDAESFVISSLGSPTTISANADISITNKVGSIANGNAFLSDTNFNKLIFRIPQSYISYGMADQSYRGRKVSTSLVPVSNVVTISSGSATTLFVGNGTLSDSDKLEHFIVITKTAAAGLANNSVVPMVTATGRTISVTGGTSVSLDLGNSEFTLVDVISTVDFSTVSAKSKALVLANTTVVSTSGGTSIANTVVYTANGQIAISSPNKTPGGSDSLYISDIFKLEDKFEDTYGTFSVLKGNGLDKLSSFKVVQSGNNSVAVSTADLTDSTKDITYRYTLDDGQRDTFYDHGAIILNPNTASPVGQILVLVNYFTHTGTGFMSVDSYIDSNLGADSQTRYTKIPKYTSPTNGQVYSLRDSIDFRPIRTNASNTSPGFTLSGIALPQEDEDLLSDYSYYIPRTDRIVLRDVERSFELIEGIPDLTPQAPAEPESAMSLYLIKVPPFTFFPTDCVVKFFDNKRYTMRDIGKLEDRINNIEYYTSLNNLEKMARDTKVLDATTGIERAHNGILTDPFKGHAVGDVKNLDYICSIDIENGELRPSFSSNSTSFKATTALTTAEISAGTIITAPCTVYEGAILQDTASTTLNINPFLFTNFTGKLNLDPTSDVWIDTNKRPDVTVNFAGQNDAFVAIGQALNDLRAPGWATNWNSWQTTGIGTSVAAPVTVTQARTSGYIDYQDTISRTVTTTDTKQARYTDPMKIIGVDNIKQSIGNRQVDLSIIPYIRKERIDAVGYGMLPNQRVHCFVDNVNVNKFVEMPVVLYIHNANGNFNDNYGVYETITSSTGATAKVMRQVGRSWSINQTLLYVVAANGTFTTNSTITGSVSGSTANVDVALMLSGNVTTSTANTITLSNGAPYNSWYSDFSNTFFTLSNANTFPFTMGMTDYGGFMNPATENAARGFNKLRIVAGKGLGQENIISAYNGSTKVATLANNWVVLPDTTSIYSVGNIHTDDFGIIAGTLHLPSYDATAYDSGYKFKQGYRKIRVCDSLTNNEAEITTHGEAFYYASGILNTIEDVSVSIRMPVITTTKLSQTQNILTYTNQDTVTSSTVTADRTPQGGGGGGCKIICTKLYELGYLPENIYSADQKFGELLRKNDPEAYNGYVRWASIVVSWMEEKGPQCMFWIRDDKKRNEAQRKLATKWALRIATPWAQHMAYIMNEVDTDSRAGRMIMKTGLFVSRIVGKLFNNRPIKKSNNTIIGYSMWAVFVVFYALAGLKGE